MAETAQHWDVGVLRVVTCGSTTSRNALPRRRPWVDKTGLRAGVGVSLEPLFQTLPSSGLPQGRRGRLGGGGGQSSQARHHPASPSPAPPPPPSTAIAAGEGGGTGMRATPARVGAGGCAPCGVPRRGHMTHKRRKLSGWMTPGEVQRCPDTHNSK